VEKPRPLGPRAPHRWLPGGRGGRGIKPGGKGRGHFGLGGLPGGGLGGSSQAGTVFGKPLWPWKPPATGEGDGGRGVGKGPFSLARACGWGGAKGDGGSHGVGGRAGGWGWTLLGRVGGGLGGKRPKKPGHRAPNGGPAPGPRKNFVSFYRHASFCLGPDTPLGFCGGSGLTTRRGAGGNLAGEGSGFSDSAPRGVGRGRGISAARAQRGAKDPHRAGGGGPAPGQRGRRGGVIGLGEYGGEPERFAGGKGDFTADEGGKGLPRGARKRPAKPKGTVWKTPRAGRPDEVWGIPALRGGGGGGQGRGPGFPFERRRTEPRGGGKFLPGRAGPPGQRRLGGGRGFQIPRGGPFARKKKKKKKPAVRKKLRKKKRKKKTPSFPELEGK